MMKRLYLVTRLNGDKLYVVATSMEDVFRKLPNNISVVTKCELIATEFISDEISHLILGTD